MQSSIGESIRQLRRQRGLTQTELGGDHFSKSYISAVERETILPSREALRFFAEQLEQPIAAFEDLLLKAEQTRQTVVQKDIFLAYQNVSDDSDEALSLLDAIVAGTDLPNTPLLQEILNLSSETILSFPLQKQARYLFLKGLHSQEQGDLQTANYLLERALALSSIKYQPAILDALGTNFFSAHIWQAALSYHQRALHLLETHEAGKKASMLLLKIVLHCGDDYQALGAHTEAIAHYERARQHLRANNNMKMAAQVYLGLGYCLYASTYQEALSLQFTSKDKERRFQLAVSYLLQSLTLCQVSGDHVGEARTRLLYTMILLDHCSLRRQVAFEQIQKTGIVTSIQCATLLDEAEEQCRQVLLSWNETSLEAEALSSDLEVVLYTALSYLVRVFIQRSAVARLEGYADTALRDRSRATHLCNLTLETLATPGIPWSLTRKALTLEDPTMYRVQSLPHLPAHAQDIQLHNSMSEAVVFFAACETAEELGRVATAANYAATCYTCTDECIKAFLTLEHKSIQAKEYDYRYLTRSYQRCLDLLEERIQVAPLIAEETYRSIFTLFKTELYQPQSVFSYN